MSTTGTTSNVTTAESIPDVEGNEDESKPNAVGKIRSETSYPYYGLARVTEIVKAVQKAGGNNASAADVLSGLGVGKTDRLWAYGMPSAIQFGLVERIGRGDEARINLTPLGLRLALPGTADEERATKAAAFKTPELYSKLLEKFSSHPVPTKEVLKNILQRDFKIVESMADKAADAFLESLKTAELITAAGTIAIGDGAPHVDRGHKPPVNPAIDVKPGMQTVQVPADFTIYRCKISGGRVIEIPLPHDFKQSDAKRLHAFLLTQVDDDVDAGQ